VRDLGGRARHLVLVDVEAAKLLMLPSPGDGEGAGRKLPERSANHGCGDLGGLAPPIRKPYRRGRKTLPLQFPVFPLPFHMIFSSVFFLARGCGGGPRAAGRGAGD
jgi:hypothetical protein